jgi:hypothetical protein
MARASVFNRALSPAEIQRLARGAAPLPEDLKGRVVSLRFTGLQGDRLFQVRGADLEAKLVGRVEGVQASGRLEGGAARFDGQGYIEVPHSPRLDCLEGVTLEAWIRPRAFAPGGFRIIDKSPAGAASAYLLDTYPENSLRLITRDPWLSADARLAADRWVHVAATVDGETGRSILYVDGKKVAER